ncbi:MAG: 50S ribosomal protein L5 [candidate division Zixibacteria bacterium]|nr:50S ribosomal protein L5 [candidate division Zixibacteria bacterium]
MAKEKEKGKEKEKEKGKEPEKSSPKTRYIPRLKEKYQKEVIPALMKKFGYKNIMQVPRLEKIIINIGVGEATQNVKLLEASSAELALITGQKPITRRAKKSISNFKLREGSPIGCCVTLRRGRMLDFFDRLVNASIPRIRDFRGVPAKSFDGRGNYNLGLKEQIIFPEVDYDKVEKIRGMNITICTTAKTDEEGLELLKALGMPFGVK